MENSLWASQIQSYNHPVLDGYKKNKNRGCTPVKPLTFPLHPNCWWSIHCDTSLSQHSVCVLTDSGSALPPALLLQELDAVVDVKLDGSPISLVAHQQGAKFQTALTVSLGWHSQLHEVPLEVSLHSDTLRL